MQAGRHTPGPWRISDGESRGERSICICTDEVNICVMSDGDGDGSDGQLADACLIAAAPELLAALRALLESYAAYVDIDGVMNADIAEPVTAARAAIAQADGRGL